MQPQICLFLRTIQGSPAFRDGHRAATSIAATAIAATTIAAATTIVATTIVATTVVEN